MSHLIISIDPASPAAKAGLRQGDRLTHIGGELVVDFLDYQALSAEKVCRVRVLRDGAPKEFTVKKPEYAELGLNFAQPMMSGVRMCANNCVFCFVDQLPENVRPTMHVKDDDWRMSMLMGNYVTLTNVPDRELDRIVRRHASPLYISVHCIDPALRTAVLRTPRAAKIKEQLQTLNDGGIAFHNQCVLVPGLNDGAALEETIEWLSKLPGALSLALVPVGLTNHREGLSDLHKYTREEACAVLDIADKWREKLLRERGTRFVFPSDEFYLTAERPLPEDEAYEGYAQIDDGVGMLRLLETEYVEAWNDLPEEKRTSEGGKKVAVACGVSAAPFLTALLQKYPVRGTDVTVYPVENRFFGSNVTVSGLITGRDLTERIAPTDSEIVLITECMLRDEKDCFLDDMTLTDACARIGREIRPVGRRGDELLDALIDIAEQKT